MAQSSISQWSLVVSRGLCMLNMCSFRWIILSIQLVIWQPTLRLWKQINDGNIVWTKHSGYVNVRNLARLWEEMDQMYSQVFAELVPIEEGESTLTNTKKVFRFLFLILVCVSLIVVHCRSIFVLFCAHFIVSPISPNLVWKIRSRRFKICG